MTPEDEEFNRIEREATSWRFNRYKDRVKQ